MSPLIPTSNFSTRFLDKASTAPNISETHPLPVALEPAPPTLTLRIHRVITRLTQLEDQKSALTSKELDRRYKKAIERLLKLSEQDNSQSLSDATESQALLHEIQNSRKIISRIKSSVSDSLQKLSETLETRLKHLESWIPINEQFLQIDEQMDIDLQRWNVSIEPFLAHQEVHDPTSMATELQFALSYASKLTEFYQTHGAQLAPLYKLKLAKEIHSRILPLFQALEDFKDMVLPRIKTTLRQAHKALKRAERQVQNGKGGLRKQLDDFQALQKARANFQYTHTGFQAALKAMEELNVSFQPVNATEDEGPGIFYALAYLAWYAGKSVIFPKTILAYDLDIEVIAYEQKLAKDYNRLKNAIHIETKFLKSTFTDLPSQFSSPELERVVVARLKFAPPETVEQILLAPFTGEYVAKNTPEWFDLKEQLALILALDQMLPQNHPLQPAISRAKEVALNEWGYERDLSHVALYQEVAIARSKIISTSERQAWEKHLVEEIARLEKGSSPWKIAALNLFFFALHAGEWVQGVSQMQAKAAALPAQARRMQENLLAKIPPQTHASAKFVQDTLSENFEMLRTMDEVTFNNFTSQYQEARPILDKFRGLPPSPSPSLEVAKDIAFKGLLLPNLPGPYLPNLSLGQWWEAFNAPVKIPEATPMWSKEIDRAAGHLSKTLSEKDLSKMSESAYRTILKTVGKAPEAVAVLNYFRSATSEKPSQAQIDLLAEALRYAMHFGQGDIWQWSAALKRHSLSATTSGSPRPTNTSTEPFSPPKSNEKTAISTVESPPLKATLISPPPQQVIASQNVAVSAPSFPTLQKINTIQDIFLKIFAVNGAFSATQISRYRLQNRVEGLLEKAQQTFEILHDLKKQMADLGLHAAISLEFPSLQATLEKLTEKIADLSLSANINYDSIVAIEAEIAQLNQEFESHKQKLPYYISEASSVLQLQALLDVSTIKVSRKTYQNVVGSYWGEKTGFEGNDREETFAHFMHVLNEKADALETHPLCRWENQKEFCLQLIGDEMRLNEMETLRLFQKIKIMLSTAQEMQEYFKKDLQSFLEAFKSKVTALNPNESFFFQTSWARKGAESGHTIVLEIIKEKQSTFSFRIYNSGSGLEFHSCALVESMDKCLPFAELVGIAFEDLVSDNFWNSVHSMSTPASNQSWQASHLYQNALSFLKGTNSPHLYTKEHTLRILQVGHCTYLSLMAVLSYHLSTDRYERFEFEIQLKTFKDFYEGAKNNLPHSEIDRTLLREGIQHLNTQAQILHRQKKIHDNELIVINQLLTEVQKTIQNALQIYFSENATVLPKIYLDAQSYLLIPSQASTSYFIPNDRPSDKIINVIDTYNWTYRPASLTTDFRTFQSEIARLNNERRPILAKTAIQELIKKIPFSTNSFFWPIQILPSEAEELFNQINLLTTEYFISLMESHKEIPFLKDRIIVEDFLCLLTLVSMSDQLARAFNGNFGVALPNLLTAPMRDLLYGNYATNNDVSVPFWHRQQAILATYWETNSPALPPSSIDNSFFFINNAYETMRVQESRSSKAPEIIEFVVRLLQRPDLAAKVQDNNNSLSERALAIHAISSQINDQEINFQWLPKSFFDLKNNIFITHFWLTRAFHVLSKLTTNASQMWQHDEPNWFRLHFKNSLSYISKQVRDTWEISPVLFNKKHDDMVFDPSAFSHRLQIGQGLLDKKLRQLTFEKHSTSLYKRLRTPPHERLLIYPKNVDLDLSHKSFQALMAASNAKTQARDSFHFFDSLSELSNKLFDPQIQLAFQYLMLENGALAREFAVYPTGVQAFVDRLAHFCLKNYQKSLFIDDVDSQIYFLQLNHAFSIELAYANNSQNHPFINPFTALNVFEKLQALGSNTKLDPQQRALSYAILTFCYAQEKHLSVSDVQHLIRAHWYLERHPLAPNHLWTTTKEIALRTLFVKLTPLIELAMQSSADRNLILNTFLEEGSSAKNLLTNQNWEAAPTHPYYQSTDGIFHIDIATAKFSQRGLTSTSLPKEFRELPIIQTLFGSQELNYKQSSDGYWTFHDNKNHLYYVRYKSNDLILGRFLYKNLYSYLAPEQITLPFTIITEQNHLWISQVKDSIEKLVFTDKRTHQITYYVVEDPLSKTSKLYHCGPRGERTNLVLTGKQYLAQSGYQVFNRLEDPKYILVWQDDDSHIPLRVELPRLGLSFSLQQNETFWIPYLETPSGRKTNFRVSDVQFHPELGDVTTYMLLEKESQGAKEQKVLIPRRWLKQLDADSPLVTKTKFDFVHPASSIPILEYPIDKKTGKLITPNTEARLFLAMLKLWEKSNQPSDYLGALRLLQGHEFYDDYQFRNGELLRPYKASELEILIEIAYLSKKNNDHTPDGIAVRTYAWSQLLHNRILFPNTESLYPPNFITELASAYDEYLAKIDRYGAIRLSKLRELEILQKIPREPASLRLARFQELNRMAASEQNELMNVRPLSAKHNFFSKNYLHTLNRDLFTKFEDYLLQTKPVFPSEILQPNLLLNFETLYDNFQKYHTALLDNSQEKASEHLVNSINLLGGPTPKSSSSPVQLIQTVQDILYHIQYTVENYDAIAAMALRALLKEPEAFVDFDVKSLMISNPPHPHSKILNQEWWEKFKEVYQKHFHAEGHLAIAKEASRWSSTISTLFPTVKNKSMPLPFKDETASTIETKILYQESMRAYSSVIEPLVVNPDIYIHTANTTSLRDLENEKRRLISIFEIPLIGNIAQGKAKRLLKDIDYIFDPTMAIKEQYEIAQPQMLNELKAHFLHDLEYYAQHVEEERTLLLNLANKSFTAPIKVALQDIEERQSMHSPIVWQELQHLHATADKYAFYLRNPALTPEEVEELFIRIQNNNVEFLHCERLQNAIALIDQSQNARVALNSAKAHPKDSSTAIIANLENEYSLVVKNLRQVLTATPHYDVSEFPENLGIELNLGSGRQMRQLQIEGVKLLAHSEARPRSNQRQGAAMEVPPGSGKSSVFNLLEAFRNADGEHLSFLILPAELLPSQSIEMKKALGVAYGKRVMTVEFERVSDFSVENLNIWLAQWQYAIENRMVIIMSDNSFKNLFLSFIEKAHHFGMHLKEKLFYSPTETGLLQITGLRKLFTLIRTKGIFIIDEMDYILDVRKVNQYAIGQAEKVKTEMLLAMKDFYQFITSDHSIKNKIHFSFLPASKGSPFTQKLYENEIKEEIINGIVNEEFGQSDPDIRAFFNHLAPEKRDLIREFLHSNPTAKATEFYRQIPSLKIRNFLKTLSLQLTVFPSLAELIVGQHYGPVPQDAQRTNSLLSMPYENSQPKANTAHSSEIETAGNTYQMYLFNGISDEMLESEIESFKQEILQERIPGISFALKNSPTYHKFTQCFGEIPIHNLFKLSSAEKLALKHAINQFPNKIIDFVSRYAMPQLKIHLEKIQVDAQLYAACAHLVKAFSGTIPYPESLPLMFYEKFTSPTEASALKSLFEGTSKPVSILKTKITSLADVSSMLHEMYVTRSGHKNALIDLAGIFSGHGITSAYVVAKLDQLNIWPTTLAGFVYWDESGEKMVRLRGNDQPVRYDYTNLTPEQLKNNLFVFFDQARARGADAQQAANAGGTISVDRLVLLYKLVQAIGRMRQFGQGQEVDFVMLAEDEAIIRESLTSFTGKMPQELNTIDLVRYTFFQDVKQAGENNFRSFVPKMAEKLINRAMSVVTDPTVSTIDAIHVLLAIEDLFVVKTSLDPSIAYERENYLADRRTILQNKLKTFMHSKPMEAFSNLSILKSRFSSDEIKRELQQLMEEELLHMPEKLLDANSSHGVQVQTTVQVKTDTAIALKVNTKVQQHQSQASSPRPTLSWSYQNLFSATTYSPVPQAIARQSTAAILENGMSRVVAIGEIYPQISFLQAYHDIFDSLIASLNFMPIYLRDTAEQPPYRPFGVYEDVASHLLVVQDRRNAQLKVIIIDQAEASLIRELLIQDAKHSWTGKKQMRVALYHPVSGLEQEGFERIDIAALQQNPLFMRAHVQEKFRKGIEEYSEEELPSLRQWILDKGPSRMKQFFDEIIMQNRRPQKVSVLQNLFAELISIKNDNSTQRHKEEL